MVLVLSIKQVPAFLSFSCGIVIAGIWAVLFQGVAVSDIFNYAMTGYVANTGIASLDGLLSRGGVLLFLKAAAQHIGDLGDGDEGGGVDLRYQSLHSANLEAVYYEVNDGLVGTGVVAFGADVGDAAAEGI